MRNKRGPLTQEYCQKYPALARRRQQSVTGPSRDFSSICVGRDHHTDNPVYLPDAVRREGMHVIGSPGSGKTTFAKCMALEVLKQGYGFILMDPNGSHDGSLYAELLTELYRLGFCQSGRVHIIDPNLQAQSGALVPINFLARLHGIDVSVLSDALVQAVERVWHGEDTHTKPTVRRRLKMLFMVLAEMGLALSDFKFFLDPHDRHGVRARALATLTNEFSRDALEELHDIALADRSKRDFRIEGVGPINRLAEFTSGDAIKMMLSVVDEQGKPRRTLDILSCIEAGDIIMVNLQPGLAMSEADADLLAALLLRYVYLLSQLRKNREPYSIFADEAHRYLTGDIPALLAMGRKFALCPVFIHQYMAQAGRPDDLMYQALLSCVEAQAIFRVKDPLEAQRLAELVLPLNLERPLASSVRPSTVGHRRVNFGSRSRTNSEANSEGEALTESVMEAHTDMHSSTHAVGEFSGTMAGEGTFDGTADSSGVVMQPQWQMFGPNAPQAAFWPAPMSESTGQGTSRGRSKQHAESSGTSRMNAQSQGTAHTHARSRASTQSTARTIGHARTEGEQEGLEPIMVDLPAAWHSIEAERYRAGEVIRALPTGRCFLAFRGRTICLDVPKAKRES